MFISYLEILCIVVCHNDFDGDAQISKMKIQVKLIKFEEFRKIMVELIIDDLKNYSRKNIVESLLDSGFVRLDKDDLNKFLKGMHTVFLPVPTVAVDIGDSMFYWLVCGNGAILVNKKDIDIVE